MKPNAHPMGRHPARARLFSEEAFCFELGCPSLTSELCAAERKGTGHPDTLADDFAEALSRTYAAYTLARFGAVLHHNFDKLTLLGGKSQVDYGAGRLVSPILVHVNGRVSASFGRERIPVRDMIAATARRFFRARLPLLVPERDLRLILNLSSESSPGRVGASDSQPPGSRHRWFHPRGLEDLRERRQLLANDTSFGTGYAPLTATEAFVKRLSDWLSDPARRGRPRWLGTDTKVMATGVGRGIEAVICAPILARHTPSRESYAEHLAELRALIGRWQRRRLPGIELSLRLNNRDRLEEDEVYLTAIGTSLESGDEGVVGRGNRVNGLITPFKPMNVEGVNGKNPVYHVGKVYNVAASMIAERLHRRYGGAVWVNLVSATGADLLSPWKVQVRMSARSASPSRLKSEVEGVLRRIPRMTTAVIQGKRPLT